MAMWLKTPPSKAYTTVPWSYIYYKKQNPGKAFYSKYVLELEKEAQESEMERNMNPVSTGTVESSGRVHGLWCVFVQHRLS